MIILCASFCVPHLHARWESKIISHEQEQESHGRTGLCPGLDGRLKVVNSSCPVYSLQFPVEFPPFFCQWLLQNLLSAIVNSLPDLFFLVSNCFSSSTKKSKTLWCEFLLVPTSHSGTFSSFENMCLSSSPKPWSTCAQELPVNQFLLPKGSLLPKHSRLSLLIFSISETASFVLS